MLLVLIVSLQKQKLLGLALSVKFYANLSLKSCTWRLVVNQQYPFKLPFGEGAVADFLRPSSNRLLILMSNISSVECKILRSGEIRCGFLSKNGAILFLWQFIEKGKPVITLDSPFDARLIPDIQLYDVDDKITRLVVDVHIVDSATKIVRGLRSITMPPGLTLDFLSAVQDQISSNISGKEQLQEWMLCQPFELAKKMQMLPLGN